MGVSVKGLIAYSMLQTRLTIEPMFHVIEREEYQRLYRMTEPTLLRLKLLDKEPEINEEGTK